MTLNTYFIGYFSHFISLNEFYLQNSNFYNSLKNFEKELSQVEHQPLKHFLKGLICICFYEPENSYNRIEIKEVNDDDNFLTAFFVDYGETYTVSKNFCYQIDKNFITRLPFQAIKCHLAGIEGCIEPKLILDYTQNENQELRNILIEPLSKENDSYKVRLFVEKEENQSSVKYVFFSKWLVDQNFASFNDANEINSK